VLHACPYKKALLACDWTCANAQREVPAVAASIGCRDAGAAQRCSRLLDLTEEQARFTLGRADAVSPLSHGQLMKLQCGGLEGLRQLDPAAAARGVDALAGAVVAHYGSLVELPFDLIVRAVSAFRLRERRATRAE